MVSPLIFLLLIHQTWAPWRPTSISHLIIFLKSDTYYGEKLVIKLDRRRKKTYCLRILHRTFCPEEWGKSCGCALRSCFLKLLLSQTLLYMQCSSVTLSRPSSHTVHHLTLEHTPGKLCHHMTTSGSYLLLCVFHNKSQTGRSGVQ